MNFSRISSEHPLGQLLRIPLKLIPPSTQVRVLQGKLKGARWIVGSGIHGYWLGSYEYEKRQLFENLVSQGDIVFDIGGHVGFYTLLASRLTGRQGRVYSFEPNPRNLYYLKKHLALNDIANVEVLDVAVSDNTGTASFIEAGSNLEGRISESEPSPLEVRTVTLDDLYASGEIPKPDLIKMDIEGTEFDALSGARLLLSEARPVILLATHGSSINRECCKLLASLNYGLQPIDNKPLDESSEILASANLR